MAHVSLYRKYRPSTFAEVVGQDHVTHTLARAVDSGTWHHAYLFTGPRGTGKTSSARIFAMALNATDGPTSSPPADDPIVQGIRAGNAPDVIEIDAASNNKVEDVRDLVDRVAFSPAIARQKVYIVDECHMLSTAAWNAFLKTIEEPPGHVVFVFATTEPHKVLPTVLSRTQRFDFRRVPAAILADHCRRIGDLEGFSFADEALAAIVRAGDGSVRDTLSVLDQVVAFTGPKVTAEGVADVLGSVPAALLDELAAALAASDPAAALTLVDRVAEGGTDLRQFATDAVEHLRSLLLIATAPEAGLVEATPERLDELAAQASRTGTADLLRAVELLNDAQPKMRRGNTRLPLEIALAKAALPEAGSDTHALAARIDRLEAEGVAVARAPAPAESASTQPTEPELQPARQPAETVAPTDEPAEAEQAAPGDAESESGTSSQAEPETPAPAPVEAASAAPALEPQRAAAPPPESSPQPAPAAGGSVTLDDVVRAWPGVVETLGSSSRRMAAIYGEGTPTALSGDRLTLSFAFDFHATQAADPDSVRTVAEVLKTAIGTRVAIETAVGGESPEPEDPPAVAVDDEASAVINREAEDAAGDMDEDAVHDAAIRTLSEVLGAKVISDTQDD